MFLLQMIYSVIGYKGKYYFNTNNKNMKFFLKMNGFYRWDFSVCFDPVKLLYFLPQKNAKSANTYNVVFFVKCRFLDIYSKSGTLM
jgi:hypothetical protein